MLAENGLDVATIAQTVRALLASRDLATSAG
jgi:hypothetical protein